MKSALFGLAFIAYSYLLYDREDGSLSKSCALISEAVLRL